MSDAVAKAKTGKTLKQWFAVLEEQGGLKAGRRNLVNHLYSELKVDEWWATTLAVEFEKAAGQVEKDGKPKGYSICSTKTIAAPLGEVFAAFGDAKALSQWFGPNAKADFKDGGSFSTGDGDKGTFTRIRPNKDIRIDWQHPKLATGAPVEVMFADKGKGKTGITLNHNRLQTRRDADEARAAWAAAFDALKKFLEKA